MLVEESKLNTKLSLSPTPQLDLQGSRQSLKPVLLPNQSAAHYPNDMSPRRRRLVAAAAQAKTSDNSARQSFGSRLNKRLSLKRAEKTPISERFFSRKSKERTIVSTTTVVPISSKASTSTVTPTRVEPELAKEASPKCTPRATSELKTILYKEDIRAKITSFEIGKDKTVSKKSTDSSSGHNSSNNSNQDIESSEFDLTIDYNSSDTAIGHGLFEIYKIQTVHYLQCGTVVHPLLPKLKVLRIASNKFIIPLSNPERYWLILFHADTENSKLEKLASVFKDICRYRNLYIPVPGEESTIQTEAPVILSRSVSTSSVSSDIACFNLTKTQSQCSSLDEELDQFEITLQTMRINQRSRAGSAVTDLSAVLKKDKESLQTNEMISLQPKPSSDTLFSKNAHSMLSWMNMDAEEDMMSTGTGADARATAGSILFANLSKMRDNNNELLHSKISQQDILCLLKDKQLLQVRNHSPITEHNTAGISKESEKSMIGRLFGW